jgi:protein MpaA
MRRTAVLSTVLLACGLLPACGTVPEPPSADLGTPTLDPGARSVEGRPLSHHVEGEGGETVLFIASIHGDEAAGTELLNQLRVRLASDPSLLAGNSAVLVPLVNPDGVRNGTRFNANGIDLNRNFPASNFQQSRRNGETPLSEPESNYVFDLVLVKRPDRIVSIHQPADRIDHDGPSASLAFRMAAASPLDVRRMGTRDGSLGAWAGGDLGIPVVTVELPRSADELTPEESWETYGPMLLEALR